MTPEAERRRSPLAVQESYNSQIIRTQPANPTERSSVQATVVLDRVRGWLVTPLLHGDIPMKSESQAEPPA